MGNRRFAQVSTSDEEDDDHNDVVPPQKQQQSSSSTEEQNQKRKRKQMKLQEEEEEEEQEVDEEEAEGEDEDGDDNRKKKKKKKKKRKKKKKNTTPTKNNRKKKKEEEEEEEASPPRSEEEEEEEEEEPASEDAKPIGEPIKTTGKGRSKRNHYEAFEYDGNQYDLEDPVLIVPESRFQKPYVAIIKDITQDKDGSVMVTGQWFYRPEEAEKKGGGNWQSNDTRELFYSFHRDEVPAESVMHRCVVHFVPLHKQLPNRKEHPGFFVRKVYDAVEKKLWKLTDKDYEDKKQHEIDLLVQKTMQRLVDLPDIEPEDNNADQEEHLKAKRSHRRKNISPLDVSREEEATRPDQQPKPETPGSCLSNASEYHCILANFKLLTGETHRDKWLERLLQGVQYVCNSAENINNDDKEKAGGDGNNQESDSKHSRAANGSQDRNLKSGNSFFWPDAAVPAVTALEKASHESLSSDFQKYNQKLRQLVFNLKNNALLARRLINGELDPPKILNMTPNELKLVQRWIETSVVSKQGRISYGVLDLLVFGILNEKAI